ncbi:hypothetical protein AB4Z43_28950 [Mesorhizobium sp. 2RAF45]|uniref:hypothetical protein n=1 Tax=Mesorhizobium sp. 2RAF45 TaxID=3233001 RepID=UPI003F9D9EED
MAGFFKGLFGGKPKVDPPAAITFEQIEHASLAELSPLLNSLPSSVTLSSLSAIVRRLYHIALFNHHVDQDARNKAFALAEALFNDCQGAFQADKPQIQALQNARSATLEMARQGGVGSLIWKLQEFAISAADTIPYVMKPEHRHLVPDMLSTMPPEKLQQGRHHYIRQMVVQNDYGVQNAVLILHGLTAKADPAAKVLFSVSEHLALLDVPKDYNAGRHVLVALGLLPQASTARPFEAPARAKEFIATMFLERERKAVENPRLKSLNEHERLALLVSLSFLRFSLAYSQLRQIFGPEAGDDVFNIVRTEIIQDHLDWYERLESVVAEETTKQGRRIPIDLALLDCVQQLDGQHPQSEEGWNKSQPYREMAVTWLNSERVQFQSHLRSRLRAQASEGWRAEHWLEQEDWLAELA